MSTNQDGPLAKLSKLLGLGELAPIAAVKRIEDRPVKLAPELFFRVPTEHDLRGMDVRYEFKGSFRGKQSWWCWDAVNGQEVHGEGEDKRMALVDLLDKRDEPKPRRTRTVGHSAFEPPEVVEDRDENFDDDLEDRT